VHREMFSDTIDTTNILDDVDCDCVVNCPSSAWDTMVRTSWWMNEVHHNDDIWGYGSIRTTMVVLVMGGGDHPYRRHPPSDLIRMHPMILMA
jgi:hypothetical protein